MTPTFRRLAPGTMQDRTRAALEAWKAKPGETVLASWSRSAPEQKTVAVIPRDEYEAHCAETEARQQKLMAHQ